ncbi:HNH endonuclease signature motif containing protein [Serratia sp. IR-2025]
MQRRLKEAFEYKNGVLFWRQRPLSHFKNEHGQRIFNTRFSGKAAGVVNAGGYVKVCLNFKTYAAHRLIWIMHFGDIPSGCEIDHINHVKTDNRIENLRLSSRKENAANLPLRKDNTSGHCGVTWYPGKRRYQARIKVDGKDIHLGYFVDIESAIAARKEAENTLKFHPNHGSPPRNAQTS